MLILHLQIDARGRVAFCGETPAEDDASTAVRVRTAELLRVVRGLVWYPDGFDEAGGGVLVPSLSNLMMFLSDVRGRVFKDGVILGEDVLRAAGRFRAAARLVAAGRYLPGLVEEHGVFHARWLPIGAPDGSAPERAFFARLVDGFARRAGRSVLEGARSRYETVHDAWLAALRSDSDRVDWPDAEDLRELARHLAAWRQPLAVSAADRAALRFSLEPPRTADAPWRLVLADVPRTRAGLLSLGQAAAVFPPLARLHGTVAELDVFAAESFLRSGAQALAAAGYSVIRPAGVTDEHLSAEAELTPAETKAPTGRSAVTTKLTIRVDGEVVTEQEIAFLLDQGSPLVFFRDRWIEVDRNILKEALRALRAVRGHRLPVQDAIALACGLRKAGNLRVDRVKAHGWLRGLLNELRGEEAFRLLPQPDGFHGTLRDYQVRGASWLAFLAQWGFGACLADDMGLGKTAQTIAFLLHRRAHDARPALVVAPVSVTTNWARECARFAPDLKVYLHQGAARATGGSFGRACRGADVVVTGYALFVRDLRLFAGVEFSALILDEAQTVKNPDTRVSRAVRALAAPVRVALTGTPLENSANDLWALEEFLNPGLLGERRAFAETFTRPIRDDSRSGAAAKLKHVLEPFMLRRLKTDPGVAAELGEKRETREWCALSAVQRVRYEEVLAAFRAESALPDADGRTRQGRVLALLTRLKEICDAPELLLPEASAGDAAASGGKIARLDELLESIFDAGESCLVFTQYAKMGRLLQRHLLARFGHRFPFLHGGLSPARREAEIAAFNADPEPNAFILSLKAGGFGLNLTRATHVIHYDRWWNPAVENQATDRAHRIGQTKSVFVHAFICAGTLEEHVDDLLESKRRLAGEIVGGGEAFLLGMAAREFERMVSLDEP